MSAKGNADPADAWKTLVNSLSEAGQRMDAATKNLSPEERADGFRALKRSLANQLGRLEVDDAHPELAAFNLWREKFYMDNPDCRYWVTEIAQGGTYRISGNVGGAVFTSINVYEGASLEARTVARITSDTLDLDTDGNFTLSLGGAKSAAEGQWVEIPTGANMVWVRQFYDDPAAPAGNCAITRVDPIPAPPLIHPDRFARRLQKMSAAIDFSSRVMVRAGSEKDTETPNEVREWSEMQGGAVYTEPGIHYQRGAWQLASGEALVIEGEMVPSRHMSILLYSRFLNSLDYNNRQVSLTGPAIETDAEGKFRIILSAEDPGEPNWLDTEGRPFGLFAIRWLQPPSPPPLPAARVIRLAGR